MNTFGKKRLKEKLEDLKGNASKALVSYLMVGYPTFEDSLEAFRIALREGTDILEIGFPFSDPVADGPTIQKAHEVALRNGITSKEVFKASAILRDEFGDIPFLLMTYYNPMFRAGIERFVKLAKDHGIDGFIVPDLPPEECEELKKVCEKESMALVLLASPTSTEKRLKLICQYTDELTYFVSLTGTTGERESLPMERLRKSLNLYREICSKPVVVGFGISKGEQAREIASLSDGVVVGSALVKLCTEKKFDELSKKVRELKDSLLLPSYSS
ncbi:tryptophan synthase subunit alpha [Thermocrinis sp.]